MSFIVQVQTSLERKLLPGGLRDQFTRLLVWEGMNQNIRMACAGLMERSIMSQWAVTSQNVGFQSHSRLLWLPFRPRPKLQLLLLLKSSQLDSKSEHLRNVSYVVNWGILRGIVCKRAISPRCRRDPFHLPALAATKGTIGAQNATPILI